MGRARPQKEAERGACAAAASARLGTTASAHAWRASEAPRWRPYPLAGGLHALLPATAWYRLRQGPLVPLARKLQRRWGGLNGMGPEARWARPAARAGGGGAGRGAGPEHRGEKVGALAGAGRSSVAVLSSR
jgi:hypothetical protein